MKTGSSDVSHFKNEIKKKEKKKSPSPLSKTTGSCTVVVFRLLRLVDEGGVGRRTGQGGALFLDINIRNTEEAV